MEKSLAFIKTARTASSFTDLLTTLNHGGIDGTLGRASYDISAAQQTSTIPVTLQPGQSVAIDVAKNGSDPFPNTLTVTGPAGGGRIEASWTVITSSGLSSYVGRQFITGTQYTAPTLALINLECVYSDTSNVGCQSVPGAIVLGYRITLTAYDAPVQSITVQPCIRSGAGCDPNQVVRSNVLLVTSKGSRGQTKAVKQAQVLWQLPSSGVFSFVIFTEGELIPAD
jgi:hypothetical protein